LYHTSIDEHTTVRTETETENAAIAKTSGSTTEKTRLKSVHTSTHREPESLEKRKKQAGQIGQVLRISESNVRGVGAYDFLKSDSAANLLAIGSGGRGRDNGRANDVCRSVCGSHGAVGEADPALVHGLGIDIPALSRRSTMSTGAGPTGRADPEAPGCAEETRSFDFGGSFGACRGEVNSTVIDGKKLGAEMLGD
jgi:hypothetical protein